MSKGRALPDVQQAQELLEIAERVIGRHEQTIIALGRTNAALLAALEEMQTAGAEMHDHFGSLMEGLKQPGSSWNAADMRQRQMQRALKSANAAIAKGGQP